MATLAQETQALLRGFSISPTGEAPGTVVDHLGGVWGQFASHAEAVVAVEAYRRGFFVGRDIGHAEGMQECRDLMKSALGLK